MNRVEMIVAADLDLAIGYEGNLAFKNKADMAHFKKYTYGKVVIMGRKTWESIPVRFRPLEGRQNVVITRNIDYVTEGAIVVHTLEEAILREYELSNTVVIIGGGEIYSAALQAGYVDELELTIFNEYFHPVDTWFDYDETKFDKFTVRKLEDDPSVGVVTLTSNKSGIQT